MNRAARGVGRDRRRQLGVRRESPGAVDDDPHGQADVTAEDRGLELTVTQLDDFGVDALNSQVRVAGPGRGCRRQCGLGELVSRQAQEVGIDPPIRCHGSTVTTVHSKPLQSPL